jgi:hypothetical protein
VRRFVALPATISAGDCDWKKRSSGLELGYSRLA